MTGATRVSEQDLRFRTQLSNLQGLLVVFMLMIESNDAAQINYLARTSVSALSRARFVGSFLAGEADAPDDLTAIAPALTTAGGPVQVAGAGWAWAFPVRSHTEEVKHFIVAADEPVSDDEQLVLRLLAWQTGAALATVQLRQIETQERSNELRDELMSGISHDMQTPLAAIVGLAGVLEDDPDAPAEERAEIYATLSRQARNLHGLVQQFLDYTRLRSDQPLDLETRPTDVGEALEHVEGLYRHKRQITVVVPDDLPPVLADPTRLEQIVGNLVSNAVKFSPPDSPVIVEASRDGDVVRIDVRDQGRGMSPTDLADLFHKYQRGSNTDDTPGSGLGLYVTRALVEAQGGSIDVDSQLDGGSTFTVRIPVAR